MYKQDDELVNHEPQSENDVESIKIKSQKSFLKNKVKTKISPHTNKEIPGKQLDVQNCKNQQPHTNENFHFDYFQTP